MAFINISQHGDFSKTFKILKKLSTKSYLKRLSKYGQMGVDALSAATPRDTGKTAESWGYEIHVTDHSVTIVWTNSNVNDWANVAVLIQYGHATRNGGYVQGIDYINPAMKPVFEKIAKEVWVEVTS
jgi:hypothetical protein